MVQTLKKNPGAATHRQARAVAVPMPSFTGRPAPMAVPIPAPTTIASAIAMAMVVLTLTLAGPWLQESMERMTHVAPDDLGFQKVAVQQFDLTDLPAPPNAPAWQADVILSLAPGAQSSQRTYGVPSSVTIAQAILESDWGRSRLATEAKNLFGIKAFGRPGTAGIYTALTWEVYDGRNVTVAAAFRAYNTLEDSIEDYGNRFHDNSRYWPALAVKDDPRAFARAIHAAGYATDPAYAPKLIALMDRFNLYRYDVQPHE